MDTVAALAFLTAVGFAAMSLRSLHLTRRVDDLLDQVAEILDRLDSEEASRG